MPQLTLLSPYQRAEFLKQSGWFGATESTVGDDWSQRKIFRVTKGDKSAIVMHAVPDDDPRMTPGHKLSDFIKISDYLRHIKLSAPEIYAHDLRHGLLLVEDFGAGDCAHLITQRPEIEDDLYGLATRCLKHIHDRTEHISIDLPRYEDGHIHKGHRRVVDWYVPAMLHHKNEDGLVGDYLSVWKNIEKNLPLVARHFVHGDFHPANLMWLPDRVGVKQMGLIDFQGAMAGPAPYDLINLLDDARRIVPDDIRGHCLNIFTDGMKNEDKDNFRVWYSVLATQFHCRVIGQAIRLAIKDGKTRLLDIIPILRHHLIRDLSHPVLHPLKTWFDKQGIDFADQTPVDISLAKQYIKDDAF